MIYDLRHQTAYSYATPVSISHHRLHLWPRVTDRQRVIAFHIDVQPRSNREVREVDAFGNETSLLMIDESHSELTIESRGRVEVLPVVPQRPDDTPPWEAVAAAWRHGGTAERTLAARFAFATALTRPVPAIRDYASTCFPAGRPVLDGALALTHRIHADFAFDPQATTIATPVAEAFAQRHGVCQDFSHIMLAGLRSLGLPCRYVSGYLQTRPPPGQPRLAGADASHAWVSLWLADGGWVDLDPTNGLIPSEEHITCAWGRDYDDVSPVTGVVTGGGAHSVTVGVDVTPVGAPAETGSHSSA